MTKETIEQKDAQDAEREACAKLCEDKAKRLTGRLDAYQQGMRAMAERLAEAIRARDI